MAIANRHRDPDGKRSSDKPFQLQATNRARGAKQIAPSFALSATMTDANKARFNAEAAAWDNNPDVHVATQLASEAILKRFPELQRRKDAGKVSSDGPQILEIGCGTGLLSLKMAPYAKSLLAVDAAAGMIDALKLKLNNDASPKNVHPLSAMLEDPEDERLPPASAVDSTAPDGPGSAPRQKFDLILSHLVLHHIPELEPLLATMHGCLKPGGYIALTDFEDFGPEARKFHPEAKMGGVERDGINRQRFVGMMQDAGFMDVDAITGFTMEKEIERYPGEWGAEKPKDKELAMMDFPFLLCTARKPD